MTMPARTQRHGGRAGGHARAVVWLVLSCVVPSVAATDAVVTVSLVSRTAAEGTEWPGGAGSLPRRAVAVDAHGTVVVETTGPAAAADSLDARATRTQGPAAPADAQGTGSTPREGAAAAAPGASAAGSSPAAVEKPPAERTGEAVIVDPAAKDVETGEEILAGRKVARRWSDAAAHFTVAIDALSGRPVPLDSLSTSLLARALAGRARCLSARGKTRSAAADLDSLVTTDPSYVPDATTMPKGLFASFQKIRAARVGFVKLSLEPADATATWNGRALGGGAEARFLPARSR